MRRILAVLVSDWPLKLGAILLAVLLYAGLVLSQNAQVWGGRVPIVPLNQSPSVFILGSLGEVRNIRYFAPREVADRLSTESFSAFVDLSDVSAQPDSPFVTVAVRVLVADQRVRVLDFDPRRIQVRLDPLVSKTVPVEVDRGTVPPGLEVRDPILDTQQVTVSGPQSFVSQVTRAVARVLIQPSGISLDQSVDLVAVDARGEAVTQVRLEPRAVRVKILVGKQLGSKSLPLNPVIVGTPANGYEVASVTLSPAVVTIEGDTVALAGLSRVDTVPVSLSGAVADVTQAVDLDLPEGIVALGNPIVRVVIQLRATTGTRDFSAGIVLNGARPDRWYDPAIDRVVVTIGGLMTDLDALQGRTFVATADVGGLDPGLRDVALRVSLPRGLTVVAISPPRVRVTVSVAPTLTPAPTLEPSAP